MPSPHTVAKANPTTAKDTSVMAALQDAAVAQEQEQQDVLMGPGRTPNGKRKMPPSAEGGKRACGESSSA